MSEYSSESFTKFIRKRFFLSGFILVINIFLVIPLILKSTVYLSYNVSAFVLHIFFLMCILLLINGFILFLIYSFFYRQYSEGRKIIEDLGNNIKDILNNVSVYVKGYDICWKKYFNGFARRKLGYTCDEADIILTDDSIVIVGNAKFMGSRISYYPVEITKNKGSKNAHINKWHEKGERIVIDISDEQYKRSFTIDFRDETRSIRNWLVRNDILYEDIVCQEVLRQMGTKSCFNGTYEN